MSDESSPGPQEPISVYAVIMTMVDTMSAVAWQKMGLQPDMLTGKIAQDMAEAKVAIDITTHLATFIEPQLDEEDKRRMHGLIRDLRVNYVQKSNES